jgi:hypothetical protein
MGVLDLLFNTKARKPATRRPQATPVLPPEQRNQTRRNLVNIAVRDALKKHGVPAKWISTSILNWNLGKGRAGLHVQFSMDEWHPRFLPYMVAFQRAVRERLIRLDPLSRDWLVGTSWKMEPANGGYCPGMPDPAYWASSAQPKDLIKLPIELIDEPDSKRTLLDRLIPSHSASRYHADFSPTQPMSEATDADRGSSGFVRLG